MGRFLGRLLGVTLCCVVALPLIPENGWAMRNGRTDASSEFESTLGSGSPSSHSTSVIIPEEDSGVSSRGNHSPGGSDKNGSALNALEQTLRSIPPPEQGTLIQISNDTLETRKGMIKFLAKQYSESDVKALSNELFRTQTISENHLFRWQCLIDDSWSQEKFEEDLREEIKSRPPTCSSRVWGFFTSTPMKVVYGGLGGLILASTAIAAMLYFGGPEIMCLLPFDSLQDFCARAANSSAASEQVDQLREQVQNLNATCQGKISKLGASLTHLPELLENAEKWVGWAYQGGFLLKKAYQEQRKWLGKFT